MTMRFIEIHLVSWEKPRDCQGKNILSFPSVVESLRRVINSASRRLSSENRSTLDGDVTAKKSKVNMHANIFLSLQGSFLFECTSLFLLARSNDAVAKLE